MKKYGLIIFFVTIVLSSCQMPEPHTAKNNPKASAYNVQLGLAYLQQGNRQRAKQKLLTALAEDPQSATANDALAYFFESIQDGQQADKYYQRAIQFAPASGAALNNYGTFLCRQARYQEANAYFLKAIADTQYLNTALAYENAGLCALAANHLQEARYYFKKALAEDPSLTRSSAELASIKD